MLIIGVDPGDSMGVAGLHDGKLVAAFQGPPQDAVLAIRYLANRFPGERIILAIERFIQSGSRHRSEQPTAQQMVGVVTAIGTELGAMVVLQGPADARACADAGMLRRLKMWQTRNDVGAGDANDANMATRHALLALSHFQASIFEEIVG